MKQETISKYRESLPYVPCIQCGEEFKQRHKHQQFCSQMCAKEKRNEERRKLRQLIQQIWGTTKNTKGPLTGRNAEILAVQFLKNRGFEEVKLLDYFCVGPFDIAAKKSSQHYVFQVTTRTHCEAIRHLRLAKDLGLKFFAVFVKPDLSAAILVELKHGSYELSLEEVKTLK